MPKKKPAQKQTGLKIPKNYQPLDGSERSPSPAARFIGPADPREKVTVTIVLRRRPDGPPIPGLDYFLKTPLNQRHPMSEDEFAAKYGAAPEDIKNTVKFARLHGLKVVETHAARRTVVVSGTVAQMSKAFVVSLGRYERMTIYRQGKQKFPRKENYRGRQGFIHVPKELAKAIVGVFGLDNRKISKSHVTPADPPKTGLLAMQQVTQLYNFPSPGAAIAGQTIGIIAPTGGTSDNPSFGGYLQGDLDQYFKSIGAPGVQPIPISVDKVINCSLKALTTKATPKGGSTLTLTGKLAIATRWQGQYTDQSTGYIYPFGVTKVSSNATTTTVTVEAFNPTTGSSVAGLLTSVPAGTPIYFNLDQETTQDICIAATAAPGATVAVYFTTDTQAGWVDLISRAIHPDAGDFPAGVTPPSVLSASWIIGVDDAQGMATWGITTGVIKAMTAAFQDAAIKHLTVCIASGDAGTYCDMRGTSSAHVYYPASDPWVLSVGGTTIGQYRSTKSASPTWVEFLWNDTFFQGQPGATGGGVSDFFTDANGYATSYAYQKNARIPVSVNDGHVGRGVPDVAGNASPNSGYPIFVGDASVPANGTSASTPLWAALVAVLNSNLGGNLGFLNPKLYTLGPGVFNPISPLWPNPASAQLAACPTDNGMEGVAGYIAGAGWDACTGWGTPNGTALLKAL